MSQASFFDGRTFAPGRDGERLTQHLEAVRRFMADGKWHTLAEIAAYTGASEASASARLRDLRKERFGGHVVEREYVHKGLWQYRVLS